MTAKPMSTDEVLALGSTSVITLAELGRILGLSEPTVRRARERGELEALGIKVSKLGAQYLVVTSSVLAYLGLADRTSTAPSPEDGAGRGKPSGPVLRLASGGVPPG